jgi:hypothetical protein
MGFLCGPFKLATEAALKCFAAEELAEAATAAKAAEGILHVLGEFGKKMEKNTIVNKILQDSQDTSKLAEDIGKLAGIC